MFPASIRTPRRVAVVVVALAAIVTTGCRRAPAMPIPEPGVRPVTSAERAAPETPGVATTASARGDLHEADVRFLQHMIPHHAQALVMSALAPDRTDTRAVRLVAERIAASQRSEIAAMQQILRTHGHTPPPVMELDMQGEHAGHAMAAGHDSLHATMPGMLTAAELRELADASGATFDRLFATYMIRHHEGALTMVAALLAAPGGAQRSEIFQLASDIDADQRAELARLRTLPQR